MGRKSSEIQTKSVRSYTPLRQLPNTSLKNKHGGSRPRSGRKPKRKGFGFNNHSKNKWHRRPEPSTFKYKKQMRDNYATTQRMEERKGRNDVIDQYNSLLEEYNILYNFMLDNI